MTTDRDGPRSNPYRPNPEFACERCIFGSGKHADWCEKEIRPKAPRPVVKAEPCLIPADCDVCGAFEAKGYLPRTGTAICRRCLAKLNLSPSACRGDTSTDATHG